MSTENRNLALSFSKLKFGDPLIANIGGSSAFIGITDDLSSALPALNSLPYSYHPFVGSFNDEGNSDVISQNPDGSVTIRAPDGTVYKSNAPDLSDRIASALGKAPGLNTITNAFKPGDWSDFVKQSGQYMLLGIIGLILLVFGIHLLSK